MASIIKNQIIKHLSSFARNLKPEQISVEVLRGKGQLRDLELNEEILAERLELPPWLKIVRAHCSSVSVKIPWTHLKSAPVELFVEELRITIRLVASSVANSRKPELNAGKPYDLAERVIEGISLHVQSIEIFFETDSQSKISFGGSIMLSQFILESRKPTWQEEHGQKININMTRMHDKTIRQVLFFKHISWRVLKIEASSNVKGNDYYGGNGPPQQRSSLNSPLRFLTENGRCRITIKKSSLDCSLIAGRIELFLEEIHWLAYMAHLRSAIDFYKHILDLANSTSKDLPPSMAKQRHQQPFPKEKLSTPTKTSASAFGPLDIVQSSHHLRISRIDLHLCDDSSTDDLPLDWNIESGAMQAIVQKLNIDFYPQNQVFEQNGDFSLRRSWLRYSAPNPFTDLAKLQLDQHLRMISCQMEPNMLDRFVRIWPQLCSRNVVIRIENLIIQAISERSTKKDEMKCLFSMNRRAKEKLPNSISFFHLETASYCFPSTNAFPVPPNSVHLMLAPFELIPDPKSMRWLVYAFENILNSLEAPQICNSPTFQTEEPKPEIRIELLMPKAVLMSNDLPTSPFADPGTPSPNSPSSTDYRLPKRFLVQASTIFLSNFTLLNDPYMPIPLMCRQRMSNSQMEFIKWAEQNCPKSTLLKHLTRRNSQSANMESLLERDPASNEWFLCIPSLWANSDFGADTWELPFLTDLSLSGFVAIEEKKGTIILVELRTDIGLALDHFQFIQLNKLMDGVNALMDQINSDRQFFRKTLDNLQEDLPLTICFQCEKTHIRLILPTGPTPSPYDTLPWANRNNNNDGSPTNTSFSYSDLPQDEAINPGLTPLNLSSRKKTFVDSAKGSSSALADSFTPPTAEPITPNATVETVGGLAVQGGLKTVNSLTEMSNVSLTGKLPVEVQVSRKQVLGPANLPDFASATPSDLESNIDDTMSLTSVSTEQIGFDGSLVNLEDDIFGGSAVDDAVEAEEALEESGQNDIRVLKQKIRFLGREINVFDVLLEDLNLHAKAVGGRTTAFGFATNIHVGERLRANCSKIYEEKGSTFDVPVPFGELEMKREPAVEESQQHEKGRNPMEEAKVKIELRSAMRQSVIKLDIGELDISLNDEVVSQLAPFIQTPTEDANPPALELNLQKCRIEIKDPKKRFPFRIKLGGLSIHDGPESQKQSE